MPAATPSPGPSSARLAIIGCGAVVANHLAPALRRIGWMPAVLIDPSPANIGKVAARLGRKPDRFVQAAEFAPVAGQFDAAIVASPHATHGPIGAALVDAGKHVFMEKPLAITVAECQAMIAGAERAGVVLSVGLLRRYLHVARWLKALIGQGLLGDIERFEAREGFVFNWATATDSLLRRECAGGGVLMDTGAHTVDLLQWWFGEVRRLQYWDDSQGGVEADCRVEFGFASGATGRLELSRTRELRNSIRVEGTRGHVEVHLYKNEIIDASPGIRDFVDAGIGGTTMPKQLFAELFAAELADFRASAGGGPRAGVPATEGIRSVELIQRCYAARQPLPLPWENVAGPSDGPVAAIGPGTVVAITGATGFIGGRLAERLVRDHGARVRCLVRNLAQATRLARLPVEIVRVDLLDADRVRAALAGADLVFHCAYDSVSRRQNLEGTRNLLAAAGRGSGVRRFVHVSTFSVYEPFPDGDLTEETADGDRAWMYVRSKLDLEQEVLAAARAGDCPGTVIQPVIVYGPFGKAWTNAPAEMLLFGTVILPDAGEGLCNCVHVDDLVDALLLAAVRDEAIGERFMVAGPSPITWGHFFGHFARTLDTAPPVFWPASRIAAAQRSVMRDVRLVLRNPKKIMQLIVRWDPARRFLQAGLDAMPRRLHDLVVTYYFDRGSRPLGREHLPDRQLLRLYSARPVVRSDKARRLIGYRPRIDADTGMTATMAYVEWAYGDLRPGRRPPPADRAAAPPPEVPHFADAS